MSGGYFDYDQYRIDSVADSINRAIETNDDEPGYHWSGRVGRGYSPETIARFREAVATLNRASAMAHRVDWLLSGDDSEESFHRRWNEEIKPQEPYKWPNP